ncbi:MAG: FAD-dependent oxidoreductase, partial [Chloroflexota bacterium]|nr:FAD-dependent oxidoreductase [Chloroflexota bacterium]
VTPADDTYDEARRLWSAVHDRPPAVIVRPRTSSAVATANRFARDNDLELAVRSGGHSPAGHSTSEGGLVVDMSI